MGVNELPALLKQYGIQSSLVDAGLEGKVVAVDLMVVLHSALWGKGVKNCTDQFWLEPPVPVTHGESTGNRKHHICERSLHPSTFLTVFR
jgi:hypothetical protein